jgi:predicted DsbA family dithiol-disulfide isomerase
LQSLEAALARLGEQVTAEVHFQPFELNPKMPAEGQDISQHLIEKYGLTPEQYKQNTEAMRARGEEVGFTFGKDKRSRIYNTFDAHRLLHWAGLEGRQLALKHALFKAYFTDGEDPSSHEILASVAEKAGLNANRAREILTSDEYSREVRERERYYLDLGINAVPSVIINERQLIRGAQPADVFAQTLCNIAVAQ